MSNIRRTASGAKSARGCAHSCSARIILLFLACLLTIAADNASQPIASATSPVEPSLHNAAPCELARGSSTTQEITGAGSRRCVIQLNARQYFQLSIDKGDLNLSLTLYGPDEEKLFEYIDRNYGTLELSLLVKLSGAHQLEVRSLEKEPEPKRYELRIDDLRNATPRDVKDSSAQKVFAEAHSLRAEWEETALRRSLKQFTQAALMWRAAGEPRKAFKALNNAAEVHFTLGEYRPAMSIYKRMLMENQHIHKRHGEIEASNQIGRIYGYLGENDKAEKYLAGVLDYYEQLGRANQSAQDKRLHAEALSYMGGVAYSKGDLLRAIDLTNRSIALGLEIGDRRGEAQARLIHGYALTYTDDQEKARTQFTQAMGLYRALEDRKGEALSLTALGTLHSLSGEAQQALDAHLKAMHIFRSMGDHQSEAVTLNGTGQVYEDLNEKLTALDNYQQALKLFEKHESLDFAAGTEYQIAGIYRAMNDHRRALVHYNRCISLSRRTKKRRAEAYALNDIAALYESQGRRRETFSQYNKILNIYRQAGDLRGQALTLSNIGDLFFATGEKQRALSIYKRALPLMQAARDRLGETSVLYNLARAARDCDELDDALVQIEQSLQIIETLRTYVSSPTLRSSYFASVHKHYGFYIDLLMRLERLRPEQGFAAMALRASESARARSFLEILSEVNMNIREGMNQDLLAREKRLEQLLNAKAQYQVQLSSNKQTRAEADDIAREIRQLTTDYQVVQAQLREDNPRYTTLIQPKTLNLDEIRAEIGDENSILLEYSLGDERSYLWAVTADSFKSYELPARATLENAAREVYALLTARQHIEEKTESAYRERVAEADGKYREKALALSRMLLGPVASQLENKRLLIVAESVLQYIPFEALPHPDAGQPVEQTTATGLTPDDLRPLVSQHEIVSLPSISILAAIRNQNRPANSPPKIVAVMADPVFEKDDPRVQKPYNLIASTAPVESPLVEAQRALGEVSELTGTTSVPRLLYTLQESEAILAVAPHDKRMVAAGFEASRATVMNAQLNQYQIVHFATHGLINNEHPELSGILLSLVNKSGERENGFLQLHDIYNLNLSAKLVVLSACSTGLGKDIKGEGLLGLTRGFMYAGSKSVVASLWKVDDRATAELMGHFYKAMLRDNLSPPAALRVAKETLRQKSSWRAPYYWAAFILQGEYREKVQVTDARLNFPYIIAVVLTGFIGLLSFLYFQKRRR